MSLDSLLWLLREFHQVLVSPDELLCEECIPEDLRRTLKRGMRRNRRGLVVLWDWSDIGVCSSPAWHRPEWMYRHGRFVCGACERLRPEVERAA